jgi:hypothetical protein
MNLPRRSSAPTQPDPSIFQHSRSGTYRSSYDAALPERNEQPYTVYMGGPSLVNQHRRVASDEIELLSPVSNPMTATNSVETAAVDIEAEAGGNVLISLKYTHLEWFR